MIRHHKLYRNNKNPMLQHPSHYLYTHHNYYTLMVAVDSRRIRSLIKVGHIPHLTIHSYSRLSRLLSLFISKKKNARKMRLFVSMFTIALVMIAAADLAVSTKVCPQAVANDPSPVFCARNVYGRLNVRRSEFENWNCNHPKNRK